MPRKPHAHISALSPPEARDAHSFPLPHRLPPVPARRSLKPRYSAWPVTPQTESMDAHWAAWNAPYLQQLHSTGWCWDSKGCYFASPPSTLPAKKEDEERTIEWKDMGIDPRLIYRSPSPDSTGADSTDASSPITDASSLLDSPGGTSASSLPPWFSDVGSEDEGDEFEPTEQEMEMDPKLDGRSAAVENLGPRRTGGKRKRLEGVPMRQISLQAEYSQEGGDEAEQDWEEEESIQEKRTKRRRVHKPAAQVRRIHHRPPTSRDSKHRTTRPGARRLTSRPAIARKTVEPKTTHQQTEIVYSCPYHLSSFPNLTCGACFSSETDVRRHCAAHLAKEFYQYQDSLAGPNPANASEYMFGGLEPAFLYCPHSWCERPFVRKDALARHMAGSCQRITDRSPEGKRERLEQARALTLRAKEHWVETPVRMPHRVEAVTAKVEGQQKRVITRIVRVISAYEGTFDLKKVKDGEEMEVWWAREGARGRYEVFGGRG